VSDSWVRSWVVEVLDLVDLMPQAHSLVGDPAGPGGGTGLSLEQRKRLTIAVELVANPRCAAGAAAVLRRFGKARLFLEL
jgi:ABC-type multidrug transport system ATPase subunit